MDYEDAFQNVGLVIANELSLFFEEKFRSRFQERKKQRARLATGWPAVKSAFMELQG